MHPDSTSFSESSRRDPSHGGSSRRHIGLLLAAAGLAAHGVAQAQGPFGDGDHMGRGPGGHEGRMPRDPQQAAQMAERMMERRTSHMLDAVDATPEQRSKVMAVARSAFKDLAPLRQQQRASKQKGRELMFAANIDRGALERLRQEQLKLRDSMGQRMLTGMVDALSLLTAEQRAKLGARAKMGPGMGNGMRDRMQGMRERMGQGMGMQPIERGSRPGMMPPASTPR